MENANDVNKKKLLANMSIIKQMNTLDHDFLVDRYLQTVTL